MENTTSNHVQKFVLSIGTNDKDTYAPLGMSDEDILAIITGRIGLYFAGMSITEGRGVWVDEKGNATQERTFFVSIVNPLECLTQCGKESVSLRFSTYKPATEVVRELIDEAAYAIAYSLNQNCVMVEESIIDQVRFVSGD